MSGSTLLFLLYLYSLYCVIHQENRADDLERDLEAAKKEIEQLRALASAAGISTDNVSRTDYNSSGDDE